MSDFLYSASGGKIICSGEYTDIADRTHGSTGQMGLMTLLPRELKEFLVSLRIADSRNYVYMSQPPHMQAGLHMKLMHGCYFELYNALLAQRKQINDPQSPYIKYV